jgi:hypothetical protein
MIPIQAPGSMPTTPPPTNVPTRRNSNLRVDAASIRNCIYHFTYVWEKSGKEYWIYPTKISRSTVSGFRFDRRFGWGYFGTDLNDISSFACR